MTLRCVSFNKYIGALSGEEIVAEDGCVNVKVPANGGEIWICEGSSDKIFTPIKSVEINNPPEPVKVTEKAREVFEKQKETKLAKEEKAELNLNKPYEEMTVEELQEAILRKMSKNGPVTEYMLGTVRENNHHGSLVTWVKSFN